MKNKKIICLCIFLIILLFSLSILMSERLQKLQKEVKNSGIFPTEIHIKDASLSLTGESIVLYHLSSEAYPNLFARRVQILNKKNVFKIALQGLQGSLIKYYQQTDPYDFKQQLLTYNPQKDLLLNPFISLVLLERDLVDIDLYLEASVTAPNQITVELEIFKGYTKKARFVSKFTPYSKEPVLAQLQNKNLEFQAEYFCSEWKERLDDYCLSKNVPFFVENTPHNFFLIKRK